MPAAQNKSLAEGEAQYFTRKFYRIVIESSRQRSGAGGVVFEKANIRRIATWGLELPTAGARSDFDLSG